MGSSLTEQSCWCKKNRQQLILTNLLCKLCIVLEKSILIARISKLHQKFLKTFVIGMIIYCTLLANLFDNQCGSIAVQIPHSECIYFFIGIFQFNCLP